MPKNAIPDVGAFVLLLDVIECCQRFAGRFVKIERRVDSRVAARLHNIVNLRNETNDRIPVY